MTLRALGTCVAVAVGALLALASAADAGLVQHWAFDETSGTTAANSVSGGTAGTLNNGTLVNQTGKIGQAYYFDGTNDTVAMTGYKGITGKASRTITM